MTTTQPQFLKIKKRLYLVQITKINDRITDLHGPYQAVSMDNTTPEQFVNSFINLLTIAAKLPVLTPSKLPKHIQDQIKKATK